ncbi:MAG: hypothetical protein MSIBF_06910 [Candidatus Altiarchaeales archaeon IMC4]|nr:MAG: hypothetical protein MSIBF_06910 [Candidatus Altiarchaeales archaeon IMC4]
MSAKLSKKFWDRKITFVILCPTNRKIRAEPKVHKQICKANLVSRNRKSDFLESTFTLFRVPQRKGISQGEILPKTY